MIKASNLQGKYTGLTDGEAYQLKYEHGENCISDNIKNIEQYIGKKVKVFRNGKLKKIGTNTLVVGDIVVVEKGDMVPADGRILEANNLGLKPLKGVDMVEGREYHQIIYQGMKVLRGYAVIEIISVGENTYFGGIVKEIPKVYNSRSNYHKKINCVIKGSLIVSFGIFLGFFIAFFIRNSSYRIVERILFSLYPAISIIVAMYPIELIILYIINVMKIKNEAKKNRIHINNIFSLGDLDNIKIICINSKMLTEKNAPSIQKLYKSGKRIIIFDREKNSNILTTAKEAKLVQEGTKVIDGNDILNMSDNDVLNLAINEILFINMNTILERRIVESISKLKLSVAYVGEDIEDSITIGMADMGISASVNSDNFESNIADIFVSNVNLEFMEKLIDYREKNKKRTGVILNKIISIRILAVVFMIFIIFSGRMYFVPTLIVLFVCNILNIIFMNLLNTSKETDTNKLKRICISSLTGIGFATIMCSAYVLTELTNDYNVINILMAIVFVLLNSVIIFGENIFKTKKEQVRNQNNAEIKGKTKAVTKRVTATKEQDKKEKKVKEVKEKPKKQSKRKMTKEERMEELKKNII